MMQIRKSKDRGFDDKGWLKTYHTFSFDTYYDENFMSYRSLRVINEDTVQSGRGFGSHSHKDMEIITYVISGALEHEDSMGNSSVIKKSEVQRMTAGTGVMHSEKNFSQEPVHFLQIWIQPNQHGLTPSYEQKEVASAAKWGQWCLIASSNGRQGSLTIHQDADLYITLLEKDEEIVFDGLPDRYYWIQVISGRFTIQGLNLEPGDGASIREEATITVKCLEGGELMLFDLI